MASDLVSRLDRLETELGMLEKELAQLRALVAEQVPPEPAVEASIEPADALGPTLFGPMTPARLRAEEEESFALHVKALEHLGKENFTVDEYEAALRFVSESSAPPAAEKPAAPSRPPAKPPITTQPPPAETPVPQPRSRGKEWTPPEPALPPRPPRRSLGQLAKDWDLVGPRGFAIVGGAVLALGIGLFFVLAANRGWIGESARVALGAIASALALGAGVWLHARFGQYWAALGAAGAGIAGAYATLAAATARYDLVPDGLGLPIAGVIAAVGTVIAVRWHSQVIAGIGLLGAALAPALQAIDTGLTWESVAFALIVLVAAVAVTVPRGWHELLHVTTAVVAAQALVLARDVGAPADSGTVAVTALLAAIVLATAVALQLVSERPDLEPLALTYALVAVGIPLATTSWMFEERPDRGAALFAAAAIWAAALLVLAWRRKPDLALVVGMSGLALTTLGAALLLSDAALTLAWAAQAIVLAALAARFSDARLHLTGIAYAVLATAYALGSDAVPGRLFDELADHRSAVLPLAASAAALAATGFAARATYARRTETGLLAFVGEARKGLEARRLVVRESLVYVGTAMATLAVAFALVSRSFDWGHVAATAFAALVGAAILGLAGALHRDGLAVAAYAWLGGALGAALAFDVPEFYVEKTEGSIGGWALIAAAASLLGGAYAHRVQWPADGIRDFVAGCAAAVAAAAAALGAVLVAESQAATGIGFLGVAAVYAGLAAGVFRTAERRNLATTMWSIGLVVLIGSEALLVTDSVWRAAAIAATAVVVAALASPFREERLWLAGGALVAATSAAVLLVQARPWLDDAELQRRLAIATGACALAAFAIAALRWSEARWRDLVTVTWIVGLFSLLASERMLIVDTVWLAAAIGATAAAAAALARPLGEERLWLAGGALAVVTTAVVLLEQARPWLDEAELGRHLAIATAACALVTFAIAALRWGEAQWRDLVTMLWVPGIVALIATERILLGDLRATAIALALTGGALALTAGPLREPRVWTAGAVVVGVTLVATVVEWTPPSHLFVASAAPADGLWVLLACLAGLAAVAVTSHDLPTRVALEVAAGGIALYALSLGILEVAERVSGASVETDFERGHTAVSGLWALVGLALLVVGLLRGSSAIRYGGLALFGLSLAKIFLYDLASLSSVARAFSFILVGGLLLAGGFFLQRLSDRLGPPRAS